MFGIASNHTTVPSHWTAATAEPGQQGQAVLVFQDASTAYWAAVWLVHKGATAKAAGSNVHLPNVGRLGPATLAWEELRDPVQWAGFLAHCMAVVQGT